ncbi:hypothetical protein [Pseudomonas sp. Marseille-QA0892]
MNAGSEHIVGTIAESILESSFRLAQQTGTEDVALDIAAWLLMPGLAGEQVSLAVSYDVNGEEREIQIDQGEVDSTHRILLASVAQLPMASKPRAANVVLHGPALPRGMVVESLYVKPLSLTIATLG